MEGGKKEGKQLTAIHIRRPGLLLERRRVLAHVGPPHVVQRAGAETVNAFAVVGSDDDVGEGGAVLEEEDGVGIAAFGLVVAG
jgi:hypothetical protein